MFRFCLIRYNGAVTLMLFNIIINAQTVHEDHKYYN